MSYEKEEKIKTYVSTFAINLSGNETHETETVRFSTKPSNRPTHTSLGQSKPRDGAPNREAFQRSKGTYFQLVSSSKNDFSHGRETDGFQKDKGHFDGSFKVGKDEDGSNIFSNQLRRTRDIEVTKSSTYEPPPTLSTSMVKNEEMYSLRKSAERSSIDTMPEPVFSQSQVITSLSTTTKESTLTSLTTQSITQENIASTVSRDQTSIKASTDRYGETDWYMDILLKMQALDMKQQDLIVQYDFLDKLADNNREGLKQARDWGRYELDMEKIEVY